MLLQCRNWAQVGVFCNILICEKQSSYLDTQQQINGPVFDHAVINMNERQVAKTHAQTHTNTQKFDCYSVKLLDNETFWKDTGVPPNILH